MLTVKDLKKNLGNRAVVKGISFEVNAGEIVALLGPNGAGKTTTLRLLAGLLHPDGGTVQLLGQSVLEHPEVLRSRLGFVADDPFLYPQLTAMEIMMFVADIRQIPRQQSASRTMELFGQFELLDHASRYIEEFSLGMKRKLSFCLALLHNPDVLILDEPLNGLDPKAIRLVKDLFARFSSEGKSILMSTHLLDIAEQMCQSAIVINEGYLATSKLAVGTVTGTLEEKYFELTGSREVG